MSEIMDRYYRLIDSGAKYAADELRGAPTSTFEIYVGHFREIGCDIDAEIERLRKCAEKIQTWRDARLAVVNLSITDPNYLARLNDLSESEHALSAMVAT